MLSYLIFLGVIGSFYALLALSTNLVWGNAGMANLGLAGFVALGAYASALVTTAGGQPVPAGLLAALVFGAMAGVVVTVTTMKLRDDYLAIVSFGIAEVVRLVALNEIWLTKGPDGISAIPRPFKQALGTWFDLGYLVLMATFVAIVYFVFRRIDRSPYGRAMRAVREDAQVAAVAGKPVLRFKTQAFVLSAAVAALAGALYGHYTSYIAPELFEPLITIYIFLAVTAGGIGRPTGAVFGAYALLFFLESTRFVAELVPALGPARIAALREILVGSALLLLLHFRPQGVFPERIRPAPAPK